MKLTSSRRRAGGIAVVLLATAVAACAPTDESTESDDTESEASVSAEDCAVDQLPLQTDGQLTIGTDSPAFPPYFVDDDPTNGKGFESAVAYAVADEMGFTPDQVKWVIVPFNSSYRPGAKDFDFDINQISITAKRAEAVTFSEGYYTASQAIITLKDSEYADATSLDEFADARLGAQVATTSLEAIENEIQPSQQAQIFDSTSDAKQALLNEQVDAIVADLPTAFYITSAQVPTAEVLGQFPAIPGGEHFGMVFQRGNSLVGCVNKALARLKANGTLRTIERIWLRRVTGAPILE
jgi:polar amino acid transport system substrate-binding protein